MRVQKGPLALLWVKKNIFIIFNMKWVIENQSVQSVIPSFLFNFRMKHVQFCDDILTIFRIGVKAGNLTPRPNCKIINDGCVATEVRISDESLDCVTGKPIRNPSEKVTFPTDAPVSPPEPKPTAVDARGGVAIGHIDRSSTSTVNHGSSGPGPLDDILNKIARNAQTGKRTTLADLMSEMSNANSASTSNIVYPQFPQFQIPSTSSSSSSSFQLFDPYTNNDPWSNWIMYNGLMDGSF